MKFRRQIVNMHDAPMCATARTERKKLIHDHLIELASHPPETEPVAVITLAIDESGTVKTKAIAIEPEHVPIFMDSMNRLKDGLRMLSKRVYNGQSADVISIVPR